MLRTPRLRRGHHRSSYRAPRSTSPRRLGWTRNEQPAASWGAQSSSVAATIHPLPCRSSTGRRLRRRPRYRRDDRRSMAFAIKAEVSDPGAKTFVFAAQKTMYGGKHVAAGDTIFVFASENEGGRGLIARGVVTAAEATPKQRGVARQTPRVSVTIERIRSPWRSGRFRKERAQKAHRLEGRSPRDRAQLQVLSPGDEQDRWPHRRGCGVPR